MFDAFKDKIFKVQDGISSSFKGFISNRPDSVLRHSGNLNSGADFLAQYQDDWEEIHKSSEMNAQIAQKLDQDINKIHEDYLRRLQSFNALHKELESIPKIVTSTEVIVNQIGELRRSIETVGSGLLELQNIIENIDLYAKKELVRKKFINYKEQKVHDLNTVKAGMAQLHLKKIKKKEEEISETSKLKQELYSKKFEEDMVNYKTAGVLPKSHHREDEDVDSSASTALDNIELDISNEALEEMLKEPSGS